MKKRKKKNEKKKNIKDPRDKRAEMIIYGVIILLALLGLISGYMMSQEFEEMELEEDGHYRKIEKEK